MAQCLTVLRIALLRAFAREGMSCDRGEYCRGDGLLLLTPLWLYASRLVVRQGAAGGAFYQAKQQLNAQGGKDDAIRGMALLGDPAMSLP